MWRLVGLQDGAITCQRERSTIANGYRRCFHCAKPLAISTAKQFSYRLTHLGPAVLQDDCSDGAREQARRHE